MGGPEAVTARKDMIKRYRCVVLVTLVEVHLKRNGFILMAKAYTSL
jgi:hypothetical protein